MWGRNYLCAACGARLDSRGAAGARVRHLPAWAYYAAGTLVLAGVVIRLAAERGQSWRAERGRLASVPPEMVLPARHAERIARRIELLEADLQHDPRDPLILTWLAENYLQLGALRWEKDRTRSAADFRRARKLARTLARAAPNLEHVATILSAQAEEHQALTWVMTNTSTVATRAAVLRDDPAAAMLGEVDPGFAAPPGFFGDSPTPTPPSVIVPGDTYPGGPGPAGPGPAGPGPEGTGPAGHGAGHSGRTVITTAAARDPFGGGFPPATPPMPGMPRWASLAPANLTNPEMEHYRARLRSRQSDYEAAASLVVLLDGRADELIHPNRTSTREWSEREAALREAVRVCADGARTARTRVRRGMFHFLAARILEKLGRQSEQCAELKATVSEVPFAPVPWRELQVASLKVGDIRGSRTAWRQFQEWALPRTRLRQ